MNPDILSFAGRAARGASTPWGPCQHADIISENGVVSVSTASHGGYFVARTMRADMPEALRALVPYAGVSQDGGAWYEEDCDWAIVAIAFPDLFRAEVLAGALSTFETWIVARAPEHDRDALRAAARKAAVKVWGETHMHLYLGPLLELEALPPDDSDTPAAPESAAAVLAEVREYWAGGDCPPELWERICRVLDAQPAPSPELPHLLIYGGMRDGYPLMVNRRLDPEETTDLDHHLSEFASAHASQDIATRGDDPTEDADLCAVLVFNQPDNPKAGPPAIAHARRYGWFSSED